MRPARGGWMWLLRTVVLGVAIGVTFLWVNLSDNPERRPVLALMQYVPYPVYLGPALISFVISIWLGWFWRGLAALSLGVVLTAIMGLCVGHADEGYGRIRFMTYNVKAYHALWRDPNGFDELALEILRNDPDVMVLQDAGELIRLAQTRPKLFQTMVADRHQYSFGQYLIASRFPLKDCGEGWIPLKLQMHSFIHCVLLAHGQEVDVVTVHFVTPRDGLNAARREGIKGLKAWSDNMNDRLGQSGLLAEQMRQFKPRPRIVAGDLNAPESSAVVKTLLHTGLRDAYSSAGLGYGYTHGHSLKPGLSLLRIDHILVSESIGVVDADVGGKIASEHRPVIADLLLVKQ